MREERRLWRTTVVVLHYGVAYVSCGLIRLWIMAVLATAQRQVEAASRGALHFPAGKSDLGNRLCRHLKSL